MVKQHNREWEMKRSNSVIYYRKNLTEGNFDSGRTSTTLLWLSTFGFRVCLNGREKGGGELEEADRHYHSTS